jgi:hypothetical protein
MNPCVPNVHSAASITHLKTAHACEIDGNYFFLNTRMSVCYANDMDEGNAF